MNSPVNEFNKMSLCLSLDAPYVVVPVTEQNKDHLLFDLGQVNVNNRISLDEKRLFDTIDLNIDKVKIESYRGSSYELLLPCSLNFSMKRCLNLECLPMDLVVETPMIEMHISNDDISFLVDVIKNQLEVLSSLPTEISESAVQIDENKSGAPLHIKADIGKMIIEAYDKHETSDDHYKVLDVDSDSFKMTYTQNNEDMEIVVALKNFSIHELTNKIDDKYEPITLFTSSSSEKEIAYVKYVRDMEGNQNMTVDVTDVNFNARETSLKTCAVYINGVMKRLEPLQSVEKGNGVITTQQNSKEFDLKCKLGKFSISCTLHEEKFAKADVSGMNFTLTTKSGVTKIKTRLEDLLVEDIRSGVLYPKIISLKDKNLLLFELTITEDTVRNTTTYSVWLRIGRIEIVLLNKFITEIIESLQPLTSLTSVTSHSATSSVNSVNDDVVIDSIAQDEKESESRILLIDLDIDVTAPIVTLPQCSRSMKRIITDLGRITVTNSYEENKDQSLEHLLGFDIIKATLSNVEIYVENEEDKHYISKNLSTSLKVSREVYQNCNKNVMKAQVKLLPIVIFLADKDIQLFMTIFHANTTERKIKSDSKSHSSETKAIVHNTSSKSKSKKSNEVGRYENIIDVEMACELMELHLNSYLLFKESVEDEKEAITLCVFSVSKTTAELSLHNDVMVMKTNIKEISADDVRPHSQAPFKVVLERRLGKAESVLAYPTSLKEDNQREEGQISFDYRASPTEQEVSVAIVDARTFVNLEFVQDLLDFLKVTFEENQTETIIQNGEIGEKDEDSINKASPKIDTSFKLSCDINDSEVVLLKDPHRTVTSSIIAHMQIGICYQSLNNDSSIKIPKSTVGILYGEYPNLRETSRPLLLPCQLSCIVNQSEKTGTSINGSVNEMKFCLSPSILSTIIQIIDHLNISKSSGEEEKTNEISKEVSWAPRIISKENIEIHTPRPSQINFHQVNVESKEKLSLVFNSIELTLGNDLEGMVVPILITKCHAAIQMSDWSNLLKFDTNMGIEINHFNEKLGAWEPLLEPNTEGKHLKPYEIDFKVFYAESQKVDFSTHFLDQDKSTNETINLDGIDGDAVDGVNITEEKHQALFIVINSDDMMQLTISDNVLFVINNMIQGWSVESLRNVERSKLVAPYHFQNMLEENITLYIDDKSKASCSNDEENHLKIKEKRTRGNSRPSARYNPWQLKRMNQTHYIDIDIYPFDVVRNVEISKAGIFMYNLMNPKNGDENNLVVDIDIVNGRRIMTFTSIFQVFNDLKEEIEICDESKTILTISPCRKASIPLKTSQFSTYLLQVKRYRTSQPIDFLNIGKSQQIELKSTETSIFMKIIVDRIRSNDVEKNVVKLRFLPPIKLFNYLPMKTYINLNKKDQNERVEEEVFEIGAGQIVDVMNFDVQSNHYFQLNIKYTDDEDVVWNGNCSIDQNVETPSRIEMKSNEKNSYTKILEVAIEKHNHLLELQVYAAFWILNKTGQDFYLKVNDGSTYWLDSKNDTQPQLISYNNRKKAKATLRTEDGRWSEEFSLSAVGDENRVDIRDTQGHIFSVHIKNVISHTNLTNIITLSPRFIISNHTKNDIVFAESNCPIDEVEWITIAPGQCSPCWLHSPQNFVFIKKDGFPHYGSAIPFNKDSKYAKKLSETETVCIDVNHLGERLIVNITEYEEGCIPLRIDNYLNIPVFIKQIDVRDMASIKEFTPNSSQFYNWTEFYKTHEVQVAYEDPSNFMKSVNVSFDDFGKHDVSGNDEVDHPHSTTSSRKSFCTACVSSCLPMSHCCDKDGKDEEDGRRLLSPDQSSTSNSSGHFVFWISYLEGMQRVLAFSSEFEVVQNLMKSGDLEFVTQEIFLSLQGVGVSFLNKEPVEIAYTSLTGGTSCWEVETKKNRWKRLNIDTSMFLEDAWKNNSTHANFEHKIEADLEKMIMYKPMAGTLRRSRDPALWIEYKQSKSNSSVYVKLHRIQVDDQQYDISYPSVLYPHPLPERFVKRHGNRPFLELSAVFTSLHDVMIFKYFKLLMQEVNLKIDRPILTGVMSLMYNSQTSAHDHLHLYEEDIKLIRESIQDSIKSILVTQSTKYLICYFHLSPIKLYLSFSLEGAVKEKSSTEDYFLDWFIGTIGIHFTDISDVVIKLAFYERNNVFLSQDMLVADVSKHYTLQAIKQFYVLVLGLDALGNPYGLITEFGKGFKDLFYEPYLGSVGGPHKFAEGLANGIRSLLGHTIGGTAGAAALITEQLGQVVAALSFDSDYKRKRRQEMREDPSGLAEGLATGGKYFVMGLIFGVSGLVTKPYQGAKRRGVEGFFKGIGRGLIGLLVKPTGGVIDFVTSSLDGVRRFAEQGGEDIIVRMRLPRLTYPQEPLTIYCSEKSFGYSIFRGLKLQQNIEGYYKDHFVIPNESLTICIFTTQCMMVATQTKFFSEWKIQWMANFQHLENIDIVSSQFVRINYKDPDNQSEGENTYRQIDATKPTSAEALLKKIKKHWDEYKSMTRLEAGHDK